MSFHYTLHGGLPGYWLVGWISMCMLVALISGVVVHKRIFKDFFTFRPGRASAAGWTRTTPPPCWACRFYS